MAQSDSQYRAVLTARFVWLHKQLVAAYPFVDEEGFDAQNPAWALDFARYRLDHFSGLPEAQKKLEYEYERGVFEDAQAEARETALAADARKDFLRYLKARDAALPMRLHGRIVSGPKIVLVSEATFPTYEEWRQQRLEDLAGNVEAEVKRLPIRTEELAAYQKAFDLIEDYFNTRRAENPA